MIKIDKPVFFKLVITAVLTTSFLGLRQVGGLQWLEWLAVDLLFGLRPSEAVDPRIILVGETEEDLHRLKTSQISDRTMAQLLRTIKQGKPIAIGLDFIRDQPVGEGREELLALFESTPNLYGVGKQTGAKDDPGFTPIAPPPVAQKQITEVAVQADSDGVLRRMFLYPKTKRPAIPNLGLVLAIEYLERKGIQAKSGKDGWLQLHQTTFLPFRNPSGPYTRIDDGSYQIFLNWRKAKFPVVSVREVLSKKVSPKIFQDRLVIVGSYAPSKKDQFFTPFSRSLTGTTQLMYGIEVQAQLGSAVISKALEERSLMLLWQEPWISVWLIVWATIVCLSLTYWSDQWKKICLFLLGSSLLLIVFSYLSFLLGLWVPLVPTLLVLWSLVIVLSFFEYEWQQRQDRQMIFALNERLKNKIDQRQVYRDSVVLSTQLSETLAEPLHNLLNAKYILSQQEQTLVRTLQQMMGEDNSLLTLNYQLSELMIIYQQITEDVERIGRKMATHFPNLESFMAFSDKNSLALEKGWVIVEALMSQLINSIRPFIFEEYSLDIWEIVSLQIEVTSAPLKETHRLLVIFNRIFDDILFETELEARPFPNIKITITGSEESGQLLINCQVIPSYQPNQFTLYFCQDSLDYYQGEISLNCSDEMTIWQIWLPVD